MASHDCGAVTDALLLEGCQWWCRLGKQRGRRAWHQEVVQMRPQRRSAIWRYRHKDV
jgi:hypothetical protein